MARYLRPWVTSTKHATQLSVPSPLFDQVKNIFSILTSPLWLSGIKCQPHIRDWLVVSLMVLIYIDRIVDGCQRRRKSWLQLNPNIFSDNCLQWFSWRCILGHGMDVKSWGEERTVHPWLWAPTLPKVSRQGGNIVNICRPAKSAQCEFSCVSTLH